MLKRGLNEVVALLDCLVFVGQLFLVVAGDLSHTEVSIEVSK